MLRSGIGMTGVTRYGSRPLIAVRSSTTGQRGLGPVVPLASDQVAVSRVVAVCCDVLSCLNSNSMRTRAALACMPLSVLLATIAA